MVSGKFRRVIPEEMPEEVRLFGDDLGEVERMLLDLRSDNQLTCDSRIAFRLFFGRSFDPDDQQHEDSLVRIIAAIQLIGSVSLISPESLAKLQKYLAALQLFCVRQCREFSDDEEERPDDVSMLLPILEEIDDFSLLKWRLYQRRFGREYDPANDQAALDETYSLCLDLFLRVYGRAYDEQKTEDQSTVWELVRAVQSYERLRGQPIYVDRPKDIGNLQKILGHQRLAKEDLED